MTEHWQTPESSHRKQHGAMAFNEDDALANLLLECNELLRDITQLKEDVVREILVQCMSQHRASNTRRASAEQRRPLHHYLPPVNGVPPLQNNPSRHALPCMGQRSKPLSAAEVCKSQIRPPLANASFPYLRKDGRIHTKAIDLLTEKTPTPHARTVKYCYNFHLLDGCARGWDCRFTHGSRLKPSEQLVLAKDARRFGCYAQDRCRDVDCYYRHC